MTAAHLLLVDDEDDLRENLAMLLEHEGFRVQMAASGGEGLSYMNNQRFDLVILDLIMPGMDGIETMLEMRRLNKTTRFVFITAFATLETAVYAVRKGASDYLAKPFRAEELLAAVRRSLEEARFERKIKVGSLDKTLTSLANVTRRRIIELMGQANAMRLTDISIAIEIDDHTKTMFHLRTLKEAGLVQQTQEKLYTLTPLGNHACLLLQSLMVEAEG
ncbi:MAG: response regulator [Magnetococcales bacterium]|nr:response regulator [Magnetococcales bacterium]